MASHRLRMTMFVPVGFLLEYTDGPLNGTKLTQYYTPKGSKTGVTVLGEAKFMVIKDDQPKAAVMKGLEVAFKEDQENLKKL